EVDVGRVGELVAAELAHADDGQARRRPVGAHRNTVALPEALLGPSPRGGQAYIGHARELLGRDGKIGVAQDVPAADAKKLPVLEAPERVPARLGTVEGPRALL